MEPNADTVLFLGAGASVDAPANGPLFRQVREAIAGWAGVRPPRGRATALLADHVIPEVFLKFAHESGYRLAEPLAALVEGPDHAAPNAVHRLAADVIAAGGRVWTTNWDTWIERAWILREGVQPLVAVDAAHDASRSSPLVKLHGSAEDPSSLRFTSSQIMQPSPTAIRDAFVHAVEGKQLFVVGYGGADLDIFDALRAGIGASRATYWFDGTDRSDPDDPRNPIAYARWRFGLDMVVDPTADLPPSGVHLVWSGPDRAAATPSRAVLLALSRPTETVGDGTARQRRIDQHLGRPPRPRPPFRSRALFRAEVRERRGKRASALATRFVLVAVAPAAQRRRSLRAIGDLTVLRARRLRPIVSTIAISVSRDADRKAFVRAERGRNDVALDEARAVDAGDTRAGIDTVLGLASTARWGGDLQLAERLARRALDAALDADRAAPGGSDPEHDWPERVSRSAFEVGQALLWAGRLHAADDMCRSGLMRAAGAKWAAWEYTIRAGVRMAADDLPTADLHLDRAITMLHAEGFGVQVSSIWAEKAAVARRRGDLEEARRHLRRARRVPDLGPGSRAFVLHESAEQALAHGDRDEAHDLFHQLTRSTLPLWAALGHLRLAEVGVEPSGHGEAAERAFVVAGCRWGALRAARTTGSMSEEQIDAEADTLGPPLAYRPDGPVAF